MNVSQIPYLILKNPIVYWTYQRIVGGDRARKLFVKNNVKVLPKQKLLDLGCGPGNMLDFLPELDYHGVDNNPHYIAAAKEAYGNRGTFICEDLENYTVSEPGTFDVVMATGVIHHLDDSLAEKLFQISAVALKPSGRLVTFDGCYIKNQNVFSKFMLDVDRGKHVRTQDQYETLAKKSFSEIDAIVDKTYFKIPYVSLIMTCKNA